MPTPRGRSLSRKIAAKLHEDVAYRVLGSDNFPAHYTISDFRKRHLPEFSDGPQAGDMIVNQDIASDLRELAKSLLYFGRHSVGHNMVEGLEQLVADHGIKGIHIVELDCEHEIPSGPVFAHSRIGENKDPRSKIEGFSRRLRAGLTFEPDVALMKLCYVDFDPFTDIEKLFDYYRSALDQLSAEFPSVRFLHMTVPLMTRKLGPKERVKLLLGKSLWGDEANIKREEFSDLLRQAYDAREIVDIARLEARGPGGNEAYFVVGGRRYACLSPAYTSDGGHLNKTGQRRAAAELARVLADNLRRKK